MKRALVIIDVQNDFLPGGALAVSQGDEIIPIINQIIPSYKLVVATQDWHPAGHGSFASQHEGRQVGEVIELHGLTQVLWPDHCKQGTGGAELAAALNTKAVAAIFRKGRDVDVDSYSAFFDNDHQKATGLDGYLKSLAVTDLDFVGLATDYCVYYSVLDALQAGYKCRLLLPACRGVNVNPGDSEAKVRDLQNKKCEIVQKCANLAF